MLGTVERVAPMEISTASPKLDFQESTGSSAMQDRGDLLQIAIHPELSTGLGIKDDPAMGEPVPTPKVSDKTTCMEEVDTGSVLHSEENKRLYNQHSEGNESSEMLPENCLLDKEHQGFSEETSGSCVHEECTVVMSSKHTCPPCDLAEGGSCMCLEDQQVPLLPCTSHSVTTRHLGDIQEHPIVSKEAFVCDGTTCSENDETNSASYLPMTLEGSATNGTKTPSLLSQSQSHNLCSQQTPEMPTCTEGQFQKDCAYTYLPKTCCVGTTDSYSQNISRDNLLSMPGDEGTLTEAVPIQPSLPASIELGAKSYVIQDSSIFVHNASSITADCLKDVTYASKQNNLDNSSQTNSPPLDLPISPSVDPTCTNTTGDLVTDIDTHIVHHENSEINYKEQVGKYELIQMEEASVSEVLSLESSNSSDSMMQAIHCPTSHINHLVSNGTDLPLACFTSHLPGPQDMTTVFTCDPLQAFTRREHFNNNLQIEKGESENPISDNLNGVTEPDHSILPSHGQSSEPSTSKETFWSSDALLETDVACQTPSSSNTLLEIQQPHGLTPPLTINQNALLPYVDIWRLLPKSKLLNVSTFKRSKNLVRQKMKCQTRALNNFSYLKESSILYAKNRKAAGKWSECGGNIHELLVHSLKTPLVKGPHFNRVLKGFLCNHSTLCCSKEIPDEGIPMKIPITNLPNHTCSSSSDAVSKSNPSALSTAAVVRTVRKSKFCRQTKGYRLPKLESLANSTLFSSHCEQRTAITAHTIARSSKFPEIAQTERIKCATPEKHISTRSRIKASYTRTPEYMCTKSIQPSTLTKPATLNVETTFTNECTPLLSLCQSQPKQIAVGTVKRKRVGINVQNLSTNLQANEKPLTMPDELLLSSKLQEDCLRQHTSCQMEVGIKTGKSVENCMLKLEPQCLTCCTTQGAKRPKTYNINFGQAGTSDFQSFISSTSKNTKRFRLHPLRRSCKVQEISNFPRKSSLTCDISLKSQQSSTCNSVSIQENITSNPKGWVCNVSTAFRAHTSQIPGKKLLPSKHVVPKTTSNLLSTKMNKMSIGFTNLKCTVLKQCTSEQALLNHLSAVATRLSDACKSSSGPKSLSNSTKVVPFRGVQFQARKLLKVFSCVNMKISSQSSENVFFASSRDHLLSRSLDLCPANHTEIFPGNLASSFPFPAFDNPTFPVSFHMKIDPNFLTDFIQLNPPDYMFNSALPVTQSPQLSEWTLSFFLSPQFSAAEDSIQLFTQWNPHFRSSHSSRSEPSCEVQSGRSSGCSILGLHTVLALSSPGCYRLWTRKRNLGSRIPTVQKQFVTQFAHGLKGLPTPFFQNRGRSSLAFSLGRVLSTWSRHGMSAFSTDYATPHPRCNTQQLNQNITICNLDSLLCHPQMSLDDTRQGPFSLPFLNSSLNFIPKTYLQANEPRLHFNVCSLQESYFKPPKYSSAFSDSPHFSLSNDGIDIGSSSCLSIEKDKVVRPVICWPDEQKDTHLCLPAEQRTRHEPPQNFSTEESNGLRSQLCFSTDQNVVLQSPSSLSTVQATGLELLKYLSTEPGKVLRSLYFLPARQGIFRVSNFFPPEQNCGLMPPCTLSSEQVGGHVAPCTFSTKPVDGLGAQCTLFTEQHNGLGLPCTLPTDQGDNCEPQFSKSIEQHDGVWPSHSLSVKQDVPIFSHSVSTEQGNSLRISQCLSTEQGGALGPLCHLPLQQADVMGPPSWTAQPIQQNNIERPHSLFSKQVNDCELPPHLTTYQKDNSQLQQQNLTIFQDNTEIPCILLPPKAFEQKETLRVPCITEKNQSQRNEKGGERKPQRVSQIKIRKTIPKPDPNLTPMGLPKPKRLNKREFSLEDIYTNKNYKSPPPARSLETIFEEPQEKNGILVSISQTKRKRILEFRDCTVPRPKRAKGKFRVMPSCKRGRKAATEEVQLDALLIQKLMDLENFLLKEEAQEQVSAAADEPS